MTTVPVRRGRSQTGFDSEDRSEDAPAQSDHQGPTASDPGNSPFVSVSVRIKPEEPGKHIAIWEKPAEEGEFASRRVTCHRGHMLEEYEFSRVFGPQCDNKTVFADINGAELVTSVFKGVNETIFAYGQTGSGKTHTIFGTEGELGLLQFMIQAIFRQANDVGQCTIHLCCFEILGDHLTDLLDVSCLEDAEDVGPDDIVYDELFLKTQKCRYQIMRISKMTTCLELLEHASSLRTSGTSSYNDRSSRSHAVCQFFIQNGCPQDDKHGGTLGALSLIDLAGSEKEQENPSEQGRKSARLLNTSLSSLNRLLRKLQTNTLNESERRQSVLNKVLWDYVRGGCGISLIFCCSPLLKHRTVSLSTLAMATDSKLMNNKRKQQYLQVNGNYVLQQNALSWDLDGSPRRASTGRLRDEFSAGSYPRNGAGCTPRSVDSHAAGGAARSPRTPDPLPVREMVRKYEDRVERVRESSRERRWDSSHGPEETPPRSAEDACMTSSAPKLPNQSMFVTPHSDGSSLTPYSPSAPLLSLSEHMAVADQPLSAEELKRICEQSPLTIRELVVQNSRLQQKLSKIRRRSRERINAGQEERKVLLEENEGLREECNSLRQLFLHQQKQQIAFWTGSFMKDLNLQRAKSRSSVGTTSTPGAMSTPGGVTPPFHMVESPTHVAHIDLKPNDLRPVTPPMMPSASSGSNGDPTSDAQRTSTSSDPEPWLPADDFWKGEVQKLRQDFLQKRRAVPGGRREDLGESARRDPVSSQEDSHIQSISRERDYWQAVANKLASGDMELDVSTKANSETRRMGSDVDGTFGLLAETSSGSGELSASSSISSEVSPAGRAH